MFDFFYICIIYFKDYVYAFASSAFAFALAFDSNAFDLIKCESNAFDSNAFDLIKCESNATVLLLLHDGYFVSWFRLE